MSTYLNKEFGLWPELFILYFISYKFENINELNVKISDIVEIVYFLKGFYNNNNSLQADCFKVGYPALNLAS